MNGKVSWPAFLKRRLTWKETFVATVALISIISAVYFLCLGVAWIIFQVKVRRATPLVLKEISTQRDRIVVAIEGFKTKYGIYPPDHLIERESKLVDARTNQLLYELTGAIFDPEKSNYSCQGFETLSEKMLRQFFNRSNIINSGRTETNITRFLARENFSIREIHDGPDVNVLTPNIFLESIDQNVLEEFTLSSWQYVSSFPTNNPGRFDLWTELTVGDKSFTISNWR